MSQRLPVISTREAVKAFGKAGFTEMAARGKGSHVFMHRDDPRAKLTIPKRKELRRGTLRSLISDAGLTVDEFIALLK
ncbi:MAG: type II toxin-antitoxin system HicA family toxin [Planctomycetota bacterium]